MPPDSDSGSNLLNQRFAQGGVARGQDQDLLTNQSPNHRSGPGQISNQLHQVPGMQRPADNYQSMGGLTDLRPVTNEEEYDEFEDEMMNMDVDESESNDIWFQDCDE